MKKTICIILVSVLLTAAISCGKVNKFPLDSETIDDGTAESGEISPNAEVFPIVRDGKAEVVIIQGNDLSPASREKAVRLRERILKETGVIVEMKKIGSGQPSKREIIIGYTDDPEVRAAYADWKYNEYGIRVIGNKLIIGGYLDIAVQNAIERFWFFAKKGIGEGNMNFSLQNQGTLKLGKMFGDVPIFEAGKFEGAFDCGDHVTEILYSDTSAEDYIEYLAVLNGSGYSKYAENRIGKNIYATLLSEKGVVHLYFTESMKTVRILTSYGDKTVLPPAEEKLRPSDKVGGNRLCIFGLDTKYSQSCGMCYVLTLEDGRYIIYDGGFRSDTDSLYKYLNENNRRKDGEIVIAAWVLTHSHPDHYLNFSYFAKRYGNKVKVQYILANGASETMFTPDIEQWNQYLNTEFYDDASYFAGAKIVKPHTGQVFEFCNVKIEVIFTHEDLYPVKIWDINESSTVTRVTVEGQTILFTGDSLHNATKLMVDMYGDNLKSDVLQVNHHGSYDKMDKEFHRRVNPDVAMYSTSRETFDDYSKYEVNKYLLSIVDKVYVADNRHTILTFPIR